MFFSKFFVKDYRTLKQKADSHFAAERFADARLAYLDALEKVNTTDDAEAERSYLNGMIARAGNRLAEMNISEAEAALRGGDKQKGHDYLELALTLADDVVIREKAAKLLADDGIPPAGDSPLRQESSSHGAHGCSSCSGTHGKGHGEFTPDLSEHMDDDEQYHLVLQTLPGNLPQRYEALGKKFAEAYMLAHDDQLQSAHRIYTELLVSDENDIILCETALLEFRMGVPDRCESLLKRALALNEANPLVHLSLAQFYIGIRRPAESIPVLQGMVDRRILHDQALLMLGDVYAMSGDADEAISVYSRGLQIPALKKPSAERLVELLTSLGREQEAAYLTKTCLKGCC